MPTEAEVRFLDAFLSEARRRIEAAGPQWMERWQALAQHLEDEDEAAGPWAAVKATEILGRQVAAGRRWDGNRWLSPEHYRAMYGLSPEEIEMDQLQIGGPPVDERPVIDAFIGELRAGRWGGIVAMGYTPDEGTKRVHLEMLLATEQQIQDGIYPEWASDEEVQESIRSLGEGWVEWLEEDRQICRDCGQDDSVLEAGRRAASLASRQRVKALEARCR